MTSNRAGWHQGPQIQGGRSAAHLVLVRMPEAFLISGQAFEQAARDDVLNANQARIGLVTVCGQGKSCVKSHDPHAICLTWQAGVWQRHMQVDRTAS